VAIEIAQYHHEKWDGSGYPDQLVGTAIPLSARIMAVADVYDALTSTRPYKAPCSGGDAYDIILKGSGTHFDPTVVSAFMKCRSRFEEIASSWIDEV
jgi:putative two-component system response regulator